MSHTVKKHLDYSLWANSRLAETVAPVADSLFDKTIPSSFPSLRNTLLHIWDAEQIWLSRLKGGAPDRFASETFTGGKGHILSGLVKTSAELRDFATEQTSDFLARPIRYKNLKGDTFENTPEGILFHVVNHGSYHRGQAVTILRQLGIEKIQSMDLVVYLRLVK